VINKENSSRSITLMRVVKPINHSNAWPSQPVEPNGNNNAAAATTKTRSVPVACQRRVAPGAISTPSLQQRPRKTASRSSLSSAGWPANALGRPRLPPE